jgi:bifunctional enzyme CysN/CysC
VDGLSAEREQGITIDVAYRFFTSEKRKFIVADTPGHEQYTSNMVTGASTADVAVLLIDARKGVLTQTRRHSYLAHSGRNPALRACYDQDGPGRLRPGRLRRHPRRIRKFAEKIGVEEWLAIPVSGTGGDNVTRAAKHALVRRADAP